ncbi:hypothetical protein BpHYR1_046638 [Brachionus plicatilis]|uniref:Uncharacterized protein n=1 Tax=Brachionus plicatilis TaxID=10195 RepID=A0A3M7Q7Q2_BRAPC|nr:hypothetical protein BpHYR1_046638 [Brachionus plicatilis]
MAARQKVGRIFGRPYIFGRLFWRSKN